VRDLGTGRRFLDYALVISVALVALFLLWPSGSGGSGDSGDETGAAAEVSTPASDDGDRSEDDANGDASDPQATEETDSSEFQCLPGDGAQVLANVVQRFRAGDFERLAAMLPPDGAESATSSVYPGMNPHILYGFSMPGYEDVRNRETVIEFLRERHEAGEVWRLKEFALSGTYKDPEAENSKIDVAHAIIQRSAPDFETHEVYGSAVINCIDGLLLVWDFETDHPDFIEPLPVDDFLANLSPYGYGEQRSLRMIVTSDVRPDGGGLYQWDLRREEANTSEGVFVENVAVMDLDGNRLINYVWDGQNWTLYQRGWRDTGQVSHRPEIPFEIMLARREPSFTGGILREHLDEIPTEGHHVIVEELEGVPDVLQGTGRLIDAPIVSTTFEIEIEDGRIIRSRYRMADSAGGHVLTPEIRWVSMERIRNYDPTLFNLPFHLTEFDHQYEPPSTLAAEMTRVSLERQPDGPGELFEIRQDELTMPALVMVTPSRGGLDSDARGIDWEPTWALERAEYSGGDLVWSDHNDAGYPTLALWDDGRFRYELRMSSQLPPYDRWDLDRLIEIIELLSG
jgi:hypothetical protein